MNSYHVLGTHQIVTVEKTVTSAEAVAQNLDVTVDKASEQALLLERSELNRLDDAWVRGFRVTINVENVVRAVFGVLATYVAAGEIHRANASCPQRSTGYGRKLQPSPLCYLRGQ